MQEVAPSPKARWHPVAMPSKSVESVAPPVVVASKVKAVMVESPENPKKKRKLVKAVEVEPKRTKLMSSAMPPTTIIKVCFIQLFFKTNSKLLYFEHVF